MLEDIEVETLMSLQQSQNSLQNPIEVFVMESESDERTYEAACMLAQYLQAGDVVLLKGGLGAGKTQFAKGVAKGLFIDTDVVSPTFNIVIEYRDGRLPLYHFDLYRVESADELEDIDFHSLTDSTSAGVSLIEWADKFPDELPDDCLEISIEKGDGETSRVFRISAFGKRSRALAYEWMEKIGG